MNPRQSPSRYFQSNANFLRTSLGENTIVEIAHERFKEKSFLEENKDKYRLSIVALLFFQVTSAGLAFMFVYHLLANLLPTLSDDWRRVMVSAVTGLVLILLEVAKRVILASFLISLIKAKAIRQKFRVRYEYALLGAVLVALSVYSSVQGARSWVEKATDKSEQIKANYETKADSIQAYFSRKLSSVEANIQALQAREIERKWGLTTDEAESLKANRAEKARLERAMEVAQGHLSELESKESTKNSNETSYTVRNMLYASLSVEAFTLICLYFIAFYLGHVFVEASELGYLPDDNNDKQDNSLKMTEADTNEQIGKPTKLAQPVFDITPVRVNKLGFEFSSKSAQKRKTRGASIDYDKMQELIDKNLNNREIASVMQCSQSSVKRFRKEQNRKP